MNSIEIFTPQIKQLMRLLQKPRLHLRNLDSITACKNGSDLYTLQYDLEWYSLKVNVSRELSERLMRRREQALHGWVNTHTLPAVSYPGEPLLVNWVFDDIANTSQVEALVIRRKPEARQALVMLKAGLDVMTSNWPGVPLTVVCYRINGYLCHLVVHNTMVEVLRHQLASGALKFNLLGDTLFVVSDADSLNGTYFSMGGVILLKNALKFDFPNWNRAF